MTVLIVLHSIEKLYLNTNPTTTTTIFNFTLFSYLQKKIYNNFLESPDISSFLEE